MLQNVLLEQGSDLRQIFSEGQGYFTALGFIGLCLHLTVPKHIMSHGCKFFAFLDQKSKNLKDLIDYTFEFSFESRFSVIGRSEVDRAKWPLT